MDGIPLNGKLDKMEFNGNYVNVVDYKTGQYKNAKNKFSKPDPEAVAIAITADKTPGFEALHGGDYWRQAVFYKILMDYDQTNKWEMKSSEFDFVEPIGGIDLKQTGPANFHKEKINIDAEDIDLVRSQIKEVYHKIMNKEFTKGCDEEDCVWCNFTREYYQGKPKLTVALREAGFYFDFPDKVIRTLKRGIHQNPAQVQ